MFLLLTRRTVGERVNLIQFITLRALTAGIGLFSASASAQTDAEVHEMLRLVAEDQRRNLPMTIDTDTTAYGIRRDLTNKRRLVYLFQLNHKKSALTLPLDVIAKQQKHESLNYFCSQPALEPFREIGVSFEYNYSDSEKQYLYSIFLEPEECQEDESNIRSNEAPATKKKRKSL